MASVHLWMVPVHKMVYQLYQKQDVYLEGKK